MTNNKKTKRELFTEMLNDENVRANAEWTALLEHEIELLDRKSESGRHNKNTEANDKIIESILEFFNSEPTLKMTCSQIMEKLAPTYGTLSLPKVSSLMTKICGKVEQPIENAPIVRVKDKKTTYFSKA